MIPKLCSLGPSPGPRRLNIRYMYPYQRAGVQKMDDLMRCGQNPILAFPMGLGKTVCTLALLVKQWGEASKKSPLPLPPDLVVAPTDTLALQWQQECLSKITGLSARDVLVITDPDTIPSEGEIERYRFVITTHKVLRAQAPSRKKTGESEGAAPVEHDTQDAPPARHARKRFKQEVDPNDLSKMNWHCIIFDEIHHEKSTLTKLFATSSKFVHAYHKVGLTGTPLARSLHDVYAELLAMNPTNDYFLKGKADLKAAARVLTNIEMRAHEQGIYKLTPRCLTVDELMHTFHKPMPNLLMALITLRNILRSHYIRVTKASVQDELASEDVPPIIRKEYQVAEETLSYVAPEGIRFYPPKRVTTYRSIFNISGQSKSEDSAQDAERSLSMAQNAKHSRNAVYQAKQAACLRYFEEQSGPMVISLDTVEDQNRLRRELSSKGGLVFMARDPDAIDNFNAACDRGEKPVILIPTVCEGLNLSTSPTLFIWDSPRSALERDQLIHRVDRIGQRNPHVKVVSFEPNTEYEKHVSDLCEFQHTLVELLLDNPLQFLCKTLLSLFKDDKSAYRDNPAFSEEAITHWIQHVFAGIDFDTVTLDELMQKVSQPALQAPPEDHSATGLDPFDNFGLFGDLDATGGPSLDDLLWGGTVFGDLGGGLEGGFVGGLGENLGLDQAFGQDPNPHSTMPLDTAPDTHALYQEAVPLDTLFNMHRQHREGQASVEDTPFACQYEQAE